MNKKSLVRVILEKKVLDKDKGSTPDEEAARIKRITRRVKSGGGLRIIRRSA
tara:strand:+ start:422 stop:577 length:156 start_codon:yes stop_codon:yes gene_type:complete